MATVNYYLKGALSESNLKVLEKGDKETFYEYLNKPLQIICKVNMAGRRLQIYTKRRIQPKYWDSGQQLIDCKKYKIKGCTEFRQWLFDLKQSIFERCTVLESSAKRISKQDLEEILKEASIPELSLETFNDHMNYFIKEYRTKAGYPIKPITIKKYKVFLKHLNVYTKTRNLKPILDNVSINFIKEFREYLEDNLHHADNTVVKNLKIFKTFLSFLHHKNKIVFIDSALKPRKQKERSIH